MIETDILVIGGGHAGIEASHIAATLNKRVILLTLSKSMIGNTPCNPHIGGSAKGIVVREIDALGGLMGKLADTDPLQVKFLNTGKGPGVRCLRYQVDKKLYPTYALKALEETPNLEVLEGEAVSLIYTQNRVMGAKLASGEEIKAKAVILTTGTYMDSLIIRGQEEYKEGPDGQKASLHLSPCLREMGLRTFRLKTGTPPRIARESIDFSKTEIQPGQEGYLNFSYLSNTYRSLEGQEPCYLTYTSPLTIQLIRDNIEKSALYNGSLTSVGPRYCPALESKVMRFSDKPRHQLFLEPEMRDSNSIYLQGFSTAFPKEMQVDLVHSVPGLEKAEILKYAYQIEYDCLDPQEFRYSLEHKVYEGLYGAGQIMGTSGYEEAGALGLIAGINAALKLDGKGPFILGRDEAYIGVMIDDLISKGVDEPYRLLSSRAEYRLLLRHDNADRRLTPKAMEIGTASSQRIELYEASLVKEEKAKEILKETTIGANKELLTILEETEGELNHGFKLYELLKRPSLNLDVMIEKTPELKEVGLSENEILNLETEIKFEGYINRMKKEVERLKKTESVLLPPDLDFHSIKGLRLEAREKLSKVRPYNLGQAGRIAGVNPADCSILLLELKKRNLL